MSLNSYFSRYSEYKTNNTKILARSNALEFLNISKTVLNVRFSWMFSVLYNFWNSKPFSRYLRETLFYIFSDLPIFSRSYCVFNNLFIFYSNTIDWLIQFGNYCFLRLGYLFTNLMLLWLMLYILFTHY